MESISPPAGGAPLIPISERRGLQARNGVNQDAQNQQEYHILKILFTLLVILCIYCLGALSLAPHLLPASFFHNQPPPSSPLPGGTTAGGGVCKPNDPHYLSPSQGTTTNSALPQVWLQSGYNEQDFAYARACAASFAVAYLSFDFNQTNTFAASASMLSAGGQQRFYGHAPNMPADSRMDPLWRASIQKEQLRQSAKPYPPTLLKAQFAAGGMLAWLQIHYQLTIYRGGEMFSQDDYMTVLVISFSRGSSINGTGWQVSDWRDGNGVFALPTPL